MKKISITSQLILLSLAVVIIASCIFSAVSLNRIYSFAEDEVYSRLTSITYLVETNNTKYTQEEINKLDMNVAFYMKRNADSIYTDNLSNFITDERIEKIVELAKRNNIDGPMHDTYTNNGSVYYYVINPHFKFNSYTIVITDASHVSYITKNVSLQTISLFLLSMILTSIVVFWWSNKFVTRLRKIQYHIVNLPKSKYEEKYIDDSDDEIGELSRSVEEMRKEIGQNEKTKQDMLQNLSHDFKTPIAVIQSYAEAFADGVITPDEANKNIIAQTEILKKKVNRLLQYNSLEYLSKDKEFEDIDIKDLVNEVVDNYRLQTKLEFKLDFSEEKVYFKGYKDNFYTVISNIIDNAIRYAETEIKIIVRENRIRIYNDGEHIEDQFLNSMFKPYEKGSKGQFGLGMSIVKKTIDFFGYNLNVVNEEPKGVSFIITK